MWALCAIYYDTAWALQGLHPILYLCPGELKTNMCVSELKFLFSSESHVEEGMRESPGYLNTLRPVVEELRFLSFVSPAMWFLNIEKSRRKSHCGRPRALWLFCCSVSFEIKPDGFAQPGSLFEKQSWWQIPGRWCLWPRIKNVSVPDGEKC